MVSAHPRKTAKAALDRARRRGAHEARCLEPHRSVSTIGTRAEHDPGRPRGAQSVELLDQGAALEAGDDGVERVADPAELAAASASGRTISRLASTRGLSARGRNDGESPADERRMRGP
jgi:hypothetical protein